MKYTIKIYYMGKVIEIFETYDRKKAKEKYYKEFDKFDQYTQLIVGKTVYTTAQAERYFKRRFGTYIRKNTCLVFPKIR